MQRMSVMKLIDSIKFFVCHHYGVIVLQIGSDLKRLTQCYYFYRLQFLNFNDLELVQFVV